ncbi:Thylakoid membrane protein [Auxenochlorella protothecoides]|uniref:Thylakoid membrane protein n=1 Tax=Auxenochlorella protothecoides TaxID=3075 RepID=A0A087SGS9_AUXPR|nr:Thylakoid membrane protein [Auxenochlorella protothecoides]KFM24933.1 Thylakoid membrane protein [Auxenochlorella protothecoides]
MSLVDAELATARAGNKLRRHAPAEPPAEGEFSIKSAREHVAAPASLALQNAFAALHSGATSPAGSIGASGAGEDAGDGEEETEASSSSDAGGSTDQYESAAPSRMASALTAFASAASLGSPLAPQRRSSGSEGEDAATSALRGARPAEARHTPSGLQRSARQGACGRPAAPAVVTSPGSQGPRNLFARHGFLPNALDMTCLQQAEGGRPQPGAMESPLKSAATVAPNPAPWGPGGEGAQSLWAAPLAADGTLPSSPFASPHAQRDADEARRAHVSHKTADTVKGRPSAAPRGRLPLAWGQSPGREGGLTAGASPGGVREAAGQLRASPGGAEGVPGRRPEDASPRGFPRTLANPLWHAPEPQPAPAQPAGGLPDNPWSSPAPPSPGAQEPAPRVSSGPSSPEPVPLGARSPQPSSARGLAAAATSRLASLFSAVTRSSPTRGEAAAAAKAHLPAGAVAVPGSVSAANNVEAGGDVARMQADAKAWAKAGRGAHADKLASAGHTADAVDPGQAPGMPGIAEATGAEEGAETPAAPSQRHSRRFSLAMDESLAEALDSPHGASLLTGGEAFSDARGTSLTPSTAAPQARPLLSPVQRQGPASSPAAGGGVSPRWPGAAEAPRDLRLSDETLRRRERAAATAAAAAGAHPHAVVDQVPAAATRVAEDEAARVAQYCRDLEAKARVRELRGEVLELEGELEAARGEAARVPGLESPHPLVQANSTSEQTYAKPATASEEYVLDSDFRIERVSFGTILSPLGLGLMVYGFCAYFSLLPGGDVSSLLLIYGFPLTLLGFALSYAQLPPVPCRSVPSAVAARESQATDIQKQVREDVTRFRYGDEQHLDEALVRIFKIGQPRGLARRLTPKLKGVREEVRGPENAYTLVLEFAAKPQMERSAWEERQEKFQSFFGPGVVALLEPTEEGMDVVLVVDGSGAGRGGGEKKDVLPPLLPGLKPRQQA